MSIKYPPSFGQILICDFPQEFSEPEMVKRRPVVCLSSPERARYRLVTIVPLSTTPPKKKESYDVEVVLPKTVSKKFNALDCWAKCDMLYTFSYDRFSVPYDGKDMHGKRIYNIVGLDEETLARIREAVLSAISD